MSLELKDIEHIAHLARIGLNDQEKQALIKDLNKIVGYVEQLSEVDTENVEPLISVLGDLPTVLREDKVTESLSQEDALSNAPDKNSDYIKVPKVLGNDEN
jgi:aspartyl-tRNA(Asn)/glutamyl-tRNA(Gln) amidotransferase subunit C